MKVSEQQRAQTVHVRWLSTGLTIGGLIAGMIGFAHLFMPTLGYDPAVPSAMAPAVRAHFYDLGTYAISGFLLSFAALSLYFGRSCDIRSARAVCSVFALFWTARTLLELRYPVELQIFFLRSPHGVLLAVISFLAVNYSTAAIAGWKSA